MAAERALTIFKEDLEGPIDVAKLAAQRLGVVAVVMGKAAAKSDLIPYITDKVKNPETPDEILCRIAQQLDLAKLIGGFDPILIPPLEALCGTEETLVRNAATKTVNALVEQSTPQVAKDHFAPMLVRLCAESNWFTSRVSACHIIGTVYAAVERAPDADDMLRTLRELVVKLGADESPMVRRAASKALGDLSAKVQGKAAIAEELRTVAKAITLGPASGAQEADAIRVLAVASLPAFAAFSADTPEGCMAVMEICTALVRDRSWKLRVAIAEHLGTVAQALVSGAGAGLDLVSLYDALQRDSEPEVCFVVANKAVSMAKAASAADVASVIMPNILALVTDQSYRTPQDRAVLADVLVDLVAHCDASSDGVARIVGDVGAILPSNDESQFVRIQLVESSPKLIAAIGPSSPAARDLLSKLVKFFDPAIYHHDPAKGIASLGGDGPASGSNPQWCWRLRFVASEVVGSPELVALGVDFYRDHLTAIVRSALIDPCTLVRVSAVTCMAKWASQYAEYGGTFGQWADENVVPALVSLRTASDKTGSKSYSLRLTLVYGVECCAGYLSTNGPAQLTQQIADKDGSADPPNLRIAVARCFGRLHQSLDFKGGPAQQTVLSALQKLSADPDLDVKDLANMGLSKERLPLTFPHWGPTGAPWVAQRVGQAPK